MKPKKLSGAELLAELGTNSLDRSPPAPAPAPAPPQPPHATPTIGRPSKVGKGHANLTVRVSAAQNDALRKAALARSQASNGKILATPQDIVRILIERAIADPTFPAIAIEDLS